MAGNDNPQAPPPSSSKSSSAPRPTLTLPPRTFNESFFTGGGPGSALGLGFSPGPMTLVSSFFADSDDVKSFSQLLAGAMASPVALAAYRPPFPPPHPPPEDEENSSGGDSSKPTNLAIVPPPRMFMMPPGLSPATLLDSPGLGLFSPQGQFGMSHQQALAQVSAQAAQVQPQMHNQPEHAAPLSSIPATSLASNSIMQQKMPPDLSVPTKESSELSHSEQRSQASSIVVDKPSDDGYNWRKYGQKQVKGSEFPRSYYKCTHPSCPVKKKVERSLDGQVTEIIYKGQHNHPPPKPNKRAKDTGSLNGEGNFELASQFQGGKLKDKRDQESSQATAEHPSGSSDSEEVGNAETDMDENDVDEPDPKRRTTEVRVTESTTSHRTVTEPRIIVQTTSEVDLLDDGYRWRKYGQKLVKGNPYPRSYYKCTTVGCNVRKHVERAAADPRAVITTYEGKHNHEVPIAKGANHNAANNEASQLKQRNGEKHALVNRREFSGNDQKPVARLRLKEEQIT